MERPVVLLDPGHGGYDPGAVCNGLKEKDLNLVLALKVAERLEGVRTLLTREHDIYVSLADRVALSKRAEPALFLSLHANAGGGHGFESFVYSGLGANDPALKMQQAVHGETMAALGRWNIRDRGMKRAAFYILKYNPRPAVLFESLFLDNAREAGIWREPLFVELLAEGIARGVRAALAGAGWHFGGDAGTGGHSAEPGRGVSGASESSGTPGGEATGGLSSKVVGPDGENKDGAPGRSVDGTVGEAIRSRSVGEAVNGALAGAAGSSVQSLYTVQVGAFAYLENARQRLAEAQAAGFSDAYIYQKQV